MAYTTKQIQRDVTVIDKLFCDNCKAEINAVYGDFSVSSQGKGALSIELRGGFGAYFDGENINVFLCEHCADQVCKAFPFFKKTIEEVS
jgi:hypothetical protein